VKLRTPATRVALGTVIGLVGVTLLAGVTALGCDEQKPRELAGAPAAPDAGGPAPLAPVRRDVLLVDGAVPPPNPTGGAATPPEQNKVRVLRYRVDADPPKPVRAVVVIMPGFLAGAGSMDGLARAIASRSTDGDALEAWVIDRRSNLLEDTHGLDVAEKNGDAKAAYAYYDRGEAVEGKTFAGFLAGPQVPWASEWGLATTLGDLRKVIEKVPPEARKARVVLLGHSLGASVAESYAAWDFDGVAGQADLAALVLADGVARREGAAAETADRNAYENGTPGGLVPSPGVKAVREGSVFTQLPLLGVKALVVAEAVAIDAKNRPDEVQVDVPPRDQLLQLVLGLTTLPKLTNAAAFGFPFDDGSALLSFAATRCGAGQGGPIDAYASVFGADLVHPSDPSATYTWKDGPDVGEPTRLADLARAWYEGAGINFSEWYFPTRLSVDLGVATTLNVTESDWRWTDYGLRTKHGPEIDLPIFAAPFRLVNDTAAYDALRALVKTRPSDFVVKLYGDLAHVDGLVGVDAPGSAAKVWYDDLASFVRAKTSPGVVVLSP
jgi:hypothetical protein